SAPCPRRAASPPLYLAALRSRVGTAHRKSEAPLPTLLQLARLHVEFALLLGVFPEVFWQVLGIGELGVEERAGLLVLGDELRILHGGAHDRAEIGLTIG